MGVPEKQLPLLAFFLFLNISMNMLRRSERAAQRFERLPTLTANDVKATGIAPVLSSRGIFPQVNRPFTNERCIASLRHCAR